MGDASVKDQVIQVKVDPELKRQAEAVAEEMGLPLSGILRAAIKQLIRSRELVVRADPGIESD